MKTNTTVVHVTHEAVGKIGGIGAVLEGLFTSQAYLNQIRRNILVSPLFSADGSLSDRLGPDSEVLYSSIDGYVNTSYFNSFRKIENSFNVNIIYGRRTFRDPVTGVKSTPEVLLFDVTRAEPGPVNQLKSRLFEEYGIMSNQYENLWEYEQYMRLAPATIAALKAIGAAESDMDTVIVSHEFMGMPTALAGKLDPTFDFKTAFYAHEVATVRRIVESWPGHDTMFYNAMRQARSRGLYINEAFGDQTGYFKHVLVEAARHCDNILAVGDSVIDELHFMAPEFELANIDLVYNGIPSYEIGLAEKQQSRERLRQYAENLIGMRPDYLFTHVTRLVVSKGLWRDLRVLEHLDKEFIRLGKTGVLFVLSTEIGPRRSKDIYQMEAGYNWPVAHHDGYPDLSGGESAFYAGVQEFNARCRNIKTIYINQFGFTQKLCGRRMPDDMKFMDIRKGSDLEFGQSIYEPFGIAQLEPLTFGGICLVTGLCGCAGFVQKITGGRPVRNIIQADYTQLGDYRWEDLEDLLRIDRTARNDIEFRVSRSLAEKILEHLPRNDDEAYQLLLSGYDIARHMGWEQVAEQYVLPALRRAVVRSQSLRLVRSA